MWHRATLTIYKQNFPEVLYRDIRIWQFNTHDKQEQVNVLSFFSVEACSGLSAQLFKSECGLSQWNHTNWNQEKSGESVLTYINSVPIALILFQRKTEKRRERTWVIMKIRSDLKTVLVYIFTSIARTNSITKPENRFDYKLQTEGFNNTYDYTVRQEGIQHILI